MAAGTGAIGRGGSKQARYHAALRRRVLKSHPEAALLTGADWRTVIAALALLAIYWTAAWAVSKTNWWVVFLAAFFFGQFVYHAASTLVHESAHRLVFRSPRAKLGFDLLIETIITSFGGQLIYQHNHVTSHHAHLGEYDGDYEHEDAFRVAARNAYRERHPVLYRALSVIVLLVHLLPFAILIDTMILPRFLAHATGLPLNDKIRTTGATRPSRAALWAFFLFSLAVNIGLYLAFGFLGWLFHVWSMSLILSRWGMTVRGQILSEHYGEDSQEPSRSTYWWGNLVFFNIGYHVEHHTFPGVAWMRLPRLKAMAPEVFHIANEHNYFGFWWMQAKSDFTLPRRRSALAAPEICQSRLGGADEHAITTIAA